MGIAFKDMELNKPIYPAIGLRTPGEQVTANFGHEPFTFDIAQYVRVQKSCIYFFFLSTTYTC